ncbi:c-type cytochrome [uncultured Gelidibacter sp.]|uniref:c-type cytochrome n=1 Tax=uncultured Gelidibacter sp. TaxID=259318 RepID=UPI00261C250E|nr:c-type cytochrome [uncultured Gelidibacter sp.]
MEDITIESTPEQIARGNYLANHVTICMDCHSERDWSKFSGPPIQESLGMGGELFDQKFGFPGSYYAKNITPTGIGRYSDAELFRAITTGITKEGRAMFLIMPYPYYGQMDKEDIKAIIAYIRTLKPIEHTVPESSSDFPMSLIINTIPHKANFTIRPEKTDVVNYGKYLVSAASCIECHTQTDKGTLVAGLEFSGGREFPFPNGAMLRSKNITPDMETGIGTWTEQMFIDLFHSRSNAAITDKMLTSDGFNTVMPWTMYADMEEDDLKAIYAYLRTVKPIGNSVDFFTPAPEQ